MKVIASALFLFAVVGVFFLVKHEATWQVVTGLVSLAYLLIFSICTAFSEVKKHDVQ